MNRADLFEGRINDKGRLIDWHDGVVLAVYPGDPPLILGLLAWFMELGIRVYAVIPLAETDFSDIIRETQSEPSTATEWQEVRRLVKAAVGCHAGPIEVLVTGERHVILKETRAEQEAVARSLPFDAEAAIGEARLEAWRDCIVDLPAQSTPR
jgi:hypothetical protein